MAPGVIYLDHHATTPCDGAVVEAMAPWWSEHCGNPSSRLHRPGLEAAAAVEQARGQIATALGVSSESVVFTSGATEANNLAIKGIAEAELRSGGQRRRLVCLATEHRAVLDPLRYLGGLGFELVTLQPQADGLVDLERLDAALDEGTLLLSVMAANNEIGVLQPLAAIAQLCRQRGIRFHCDGAQAVGHIPLQPTSLGLDLLSVSGHKLYGPKGIGALLVDPAITLLPQLHGGSQERGLRAGTLPVPLIVGFAKAVELAMADQMERGERLGALRDALWGQCEQIGAVERNGAASPRLPHNLNITVKGVEGTALHRELRRHLAVSSGSACSSGEPSHVLQALGRSRQEAAASIRFGLGRGTSAADIHRASEILSRCVAELRAA